MDKSNGKEEPTPARNILKETADEKNCPEPENPLAMDTNLRLVENEPSHQRHPLHPHGDTSSAHADEDCNGSSHVYNLDDDSESRSVSSGSSDDDSGSQTSSGSEDSDTSTLSSCTTESYERLPSGVPSELALTASTVAAMATFMQSDKAQSVMCGLAERGKTLSSINWLASHVPVSVLNRLGDEVRIGMEKQTSLTADSLVTAFLSDQGEKAGRKAQNQSGESHGSEDVEDVSDLSEVDDYYTHNPGAIERRRTALRDEGGLRVPLPARADVTSQPLTGGKSFPHLSGNEGEHKSLDRRKSFDGQNGAQLSNRSIAQLNDERTKHELALHSSWRQARLRRGSFNGSRSLQESMSSMESMFEDSQSTCSSKNREVLSQGMDGINGSMQRMSLHRGNMAIHTEESSDAGDSVDKDNESIGHKLALRAFGIGSSNAKAAQSFTDPFPCDSSEEERTQRKGRQAARRRSSRGAWQQYPQSFRRRNALGRRNEETFLLPHSTRHQSALLFIDISGFTKLATTLDPESLSKAINSYFQLIVNVVVSHGGDILKFAGDAVFVEWKATPSRIAGPQLIKTTTMPLPDCVYVAAVCASRIVAQCSDFPIFAHGVGTGGQGAQVATLNVHCGIGAGELVGVHVGDYECRREFVMLGDPIDQVAEAVDAATLGEVAVSPQALTTLAISCDLHDSVSSAPAGKAVVIVQRSLSLFTAKNKTVTELISDGDRSLALSSHVEEWPLETLKQYRKLISLYAHPVVVNNDASQSRNPTTKSSAQERHREEAELRSVYVMFIAPLISTRLSGNEDVDRYLFKLLNNIINLTTRELNRFNGHLRQFIVDDKGLVLIATFGLRGSTFPNMVAERALPATIVIHNALLNELAVQNQIGATVGNAYCGVVGGIKRHEYAVLGPSVNLAARLMGSPQNPGILVDDAVRMMADRSYGFNALPPVKAKGYSEPVPIYEPLSPLERSWGRVQANFVGRRKEIMELMGSAREIALNQHKSKLVFLSAESGMGKSTMVVHAIEHIRKMMGRRRFIVTKHVSKESDLLVPFGMFRSILVDVMSHFHTSADERSLVSYGTSEGLESVGWESLSGGSFSGGSFAASAATGMTRSADRLGNICRELNAPQAFQELVGHHLLGIDAQVGGIRTAVRKGNKPHSMKSLVSFMAKAFIRCTQDASLVILALDDVHYMDEMSWRVVEELFTTGTGMLFICTSRPLTTYKLSISSQFWDALEGVHTENGTYVAMKMESLGEDDIRDMIAKTLGMQESQISSTLQRDVLMHSGGMPHFASEILETMKRRFASDGQARRAAEDYNAETAFESVAELLLHRIDSFDVSVRNVLNLGAVLGNSFELIEIVAVLQRMSGEDPQVDNLRMESTRAALEFAVEEAILYMQYDTGDKKDSAEILFGESMTSMASSNPNRSHRPDGHPSNNLTYTFCHDIWRTMILNLMLDSRKRDMHRIIAVTLEAQHGDDTDDYLSRMKLFSHWKASGESTKAAKLALCIGNSFESLGLQDQSIKLYEDAIEMWHDKSTEGGGFTKQVLDSINVTDLECIIRVYIASGKCLANMHKGAESVLAYQNALRVLQSAKSSEELRDRSIVFPIFSGLFIALKFGQIDQDELGTYEQGLVERFVHETRLHGDPIHHARALSMQGEMYGRLGIYDKAFAVKEQMHLVYDPETMSGSLCKDYGSDRSAQLYCVSILWYRARGQNAEALEMCWYIINDLIPKMDKRNVHNSMMMMYPVLWTLKDNGFATEARKHFTRIVVDAFDKYYGDGRSTFCLPLYDPILMLLNLAGGGKVTPESHGEYIEWALNEQNLRFGTVLNCSTGNLGRCADSITAEICYLLALRLDDGEDKRALVLSGLDIAMEMVSLAKKKRMIHARSEVEAIYQRLSSLALELGVEI